MSEPIESWMSPQERMARDRRNRGPVERRVRPCDVVFTLSAEQQDELNTLPLHQRATKYREWQQAWIASR